MKKIIIIVSAMLISIVGRAADKSAAPSPQTNDPISSHYMLVEDLPTTRPVTSLLSFRGKLLLGSDDGLFIQQKDKEWKRALPIPHSVMSLTESGGMVYVRINKSKSKFRADIWYYKSHDGITFEPVYKPVLTPDIAFDSIRNIEYRATKDIDYKSALFSSTEGNPLKHHDDKKLARINSLAVQSRSGHLLVGTHQELFISKNQGESFTPLNAILGVPAFKGGHVYKLLVNNYYMVVEVDGNRIFASADSGNSWKELSKEKPLTTPKGQWSLQQICTLNGFRLVVRKNSDYFVMDLANDTFSQVHLPRYYQYAAFTIHDDMFYAASKPLFEQLMSNMAGRDRKRKAPLLRLSLKPIPACRLLAGNQKPVTLLGHVNNRPLVDNDSIYINKDNYLWNMVSNKKLSDKRISGKVLKKGSKEHWYIKNATMQNVSDKKFTTYTLIHSKDKGRSWQNTATMIGQPSNAIYDDSLQVFYSHYRWTLLRGDWKHNHTTQHRFTHEEGEITQLHVDTHSRLWVMTTQGLFVSTLHGFERITLPFKIKQLPITGFALLEHHIVINYDGRIYISPIDKDERKWELYTLCDELCNDDAEMAFRLVGSSKQLLVFQEQTYGHIWLLNPDTDEKQRVYFPRENGVIRKIQIRSNKQLLVETTGVPIIPNGDKDTSKLMKHAPLFSYTIHLKH